MRIFNVLLEVSIYAAVIFTIIMLFKHLFRDKMSPALHYCIWALFILRLAVPLTFETSFNFVDILSVGTQQEMRQNTDNDMDYVTNNMNESASSNIDSPSTSPDTYGQTVAQNSAQSQWEQQGDATVMSIIKNVISKLSLWDWLLIIWIAGIFTLLAYFVWQYGQLQRNLKISFTLPPKDLSGLLDECKQEMGIKRKIMISYHTGLPTPALLFPSTILIPVEMLNNMSTEQLRMVLYHELMHYKRKDYILCNFMIVLLAVYWFNPFVWVAYGKIREDMEIACDSMVVKRMRIEDKAYYAGTLLSMFSKPKMGQMVLGMALGSTKRIAEKRIRGIYMAQKSKRFVRLSATVLVPALLVSCFTTACQSNPEKNVVDNKPEAERKLEEKIAQDDTEQTDFIYSFPETVKEDWNAKDQNVTIKLEADVVVPDATKYPVLTVESEPISMDFVEKAAEILLEGKTLYEPRIGRSKEEITEEILELQKALADPKNSNSDGLTSQDPEEVQDTIRLFEDRIEMLKGLYEDASDNPVRKEAEFVFKPISYYEDPVMWQESMADESDETQVLKDSQKIILDADLEGGYYGRITVQNNFDSYGGYCGFDFVKSKTLAEDYSPDLGAGVNEIKMSEQDAIKLAEDMLDQLGISNMVLAEDSNGEAKAGLYTFKFIPAYQGVSLIGKESLSAEDYRPSVEVESVTILVNGDDIVKVGWVSPKTKKIENDNVELLDFEQVLERARTQMELEYNLAKMCWYTSDEPEYEEYMASFKSASVVVDEISLVLLQTPKKDNLKEYRIIPAWVFKGSETRYYKDDSPYEDFTNEEMPLFAINAVDGTLIKISYLSLGMGN